MSWEKVFSNNGPMGDRIVAELRKESRYKRPCMVFRWFLKTYTKIASVTTRTAQDMKVGKCVMESDVN